MLASNSTILLSLLKTKKHGIYFATFQKSFAICGFVSFERNFYSKIEGMKAHIPGEAFNL